MQTICEKLNSARLPFEPVATRVERLAESVTVLKGLFGDGPFTFQGRHYAITDHDGQPKPVQKPHPPLLIGGGGRRTLSLAAREAASWVSLRASCPVSGSSRAA